LTERLFWANPYQIEFDAKVISINENKVVLDKTCFLPQEEGFPGDTGEINGIGVLNTQQGEEHSIVHILEKKPEFKVGDNVHGRIDWPKRYRIMKLHTAAHIVHFLMQEFFGETYYLLADKLDMDKLKHVEEKANQLFCKSYEVRTWSDESAPNRRYWNIEPFQVVVLCNGLHVKNTNEVGRITIKKGKLLGSKARIELDLLD